MFGRRTKAEAVEPAPSELKEAVREARIEAAERSAVVVDLRDAELARLELLDEALAPVFKDIPADVELFDRGLSRGDVPRLWVDVVAHVEMGRDKRQYRFVQDTRYGRAVLAESYEVADIREAVMRYVARRLVERERALADDEGRPVAQAVLRATRARRRWRALRDFLLGLVVGIVGLIVLVLIAAPQR
jgi:hypothetical protein